MKKPLEIADERISVQPSGVSTLHLGDETVYNILPEHADVIRKAMVRAVEADRAQRFTLPPILAGVVQPADGGIFVNERGDYIVEPIGDETLELIYVAADGSTSTGRGEWETGWEA